MLLFEKFDKNYVIEKSMDFRMKAGNKMLEWTTQTTSLYTKIHCTHKKEKSRKYFKFFMSSESE